MIRASLRYAKGHVETLLAVVNFGLTSVYWLALAFAMSATSYGNMMTLQASVLIVITLFTLRTHDLVFNLLARHGESIESGFRAALRIELMVAIAGTAVCAAGALFVYPPKEAPLMTIGVISFALISSIGANQGASIAKLRYFERGDIIAKIDLLCMATWIGACASILLVPGRPPLAMLIIGAVPTATRTVALIVGARALPAPAEDPEPEPGSVKKGLLIQFLGAAQIVNFLKNGAVPIETMILAFFTPPATVAMYRVARAVQGASNAAMNVSYQRIYPALARARSLDEATAFARKLQRNSVLICMLFYPLSASVALVYALLKPQVGVIELQLITAGTFISLLCAGYQQSSFAILSIAGDHRSTGLAYIVSFAVLALSAVMLFAWPRVEIFMLGVVGASLARVWFLSARSRRTIEAMPAPAGMVEAELRNALQDG